METFTHTHTQTTGKKLTYAVKCDQNSYTVSLDGKVVKLAKFSLQLGDVQGTQAVCIEAKSAIENSADFE
ncbi:hypothetical protein ACO0LM_25125 [Undibacterium sp. Di26W]|uniref:hypothetical protein n=1 Tax=Undibacterium sp. Di26W TaxID=3413035 RepID=UPI003BF1742B